MRESLLNACLILLLMMSFSELSWSQKSQEIGTLVINGASGQAAVVQIEGRAYVDVAALAHIVNGSLSFQSNQIVLTLPTLTGIAPTISGPTDQPGEPGLSRDFVKAGIEEIALMREWASPLAYAIENGYQVSDDWVAGYREPAAKGLKMASMAASTNADRNALQLLTNEFETLREWSNRLVEARKSLDAKYAVSGTALRQDPLSQKIINCGHFLASMLGSGSFQDDSSCH